MIEPLKDSVLLSFFLESIPLGTENISRFCCTVYKLSISILFFSRKTMFLTKRTLQVNKKRKCYRLRRHYTHTKRKKTLQQENIISKQKRKCYRLREHHAYTKRKRTLQ